jgi:hypothetical protein
VCLSRARRTPWRLDFAQVRGMVVEDLALPVPLVGGNGRTYLRGIATLMAPPPTPVIGGGASKSVPGPRPIARFARPLGAECSPVKRQPAAVPTRAAAARQVRPRAGIAARPGRRSEGRIGPPLLMKPLLRRGFRRCGGFRAQGPEVPRGYQRCAKRIPVRPRRRTPIADVGPPLGALTVRDRHTYGGKPRRRTACKLADSLLCAPLSDAGAADAKRRCARRLPLPSRVIRGSDCP